RGSIPEVLQGLSAVGISIVPAGRWRRRRLTSGAAGSRDQPRRPIHWLGDSTTRQWRALTLASAISAVRGARASYPSPDATTPGYWQGKIDDLAIWKRVLTPGEIAQIYQAGLDGISVAAVASRPSGSPCTRDLTCVSTKCTGGSCE